MIHNRKIALRFRIVSFGFVLLGLLLSMKVFEGQLHLAQFMYYTIQSNFLGLVLFALLIFKTQRERRHFGDDGSASYYPRFEMVVVIDLLLTLIVYWVMLAPQSFSMDANTNLFTLSNLTVHLITPLLCLVDYVLFADSGHLKYRDVYAVLIYPLCYVLFSSAAGLLGYVYRISTADGLPVRFPYFFFDFDRIGMKSLGYIAALVGFFLVISHIFYIIDHRFRKPVLIPRPHTLNSAFQKKSKRY